MRKIFVMAGLVAMLASCASEPQTIRRPVEMVTAQEIFCNRYIVRVFFPSMDNLDFYYPKSVTFETASVDTCYSMLYYDCPIDSITGIEVDDEFTKTIMMYE